MQDKKNGGFVYTLNQDGTWDKAKAMVADNRGDRCFGSAVKN